jgi:hypothetical protein
VVDKYFDLQNENSCENVKDEKLNGNQDCDSFFVKFTKNLKDLFLF